MAMGAISRLGLSGNEVPMIKQTLIRKLTLGAMLGFCCIAVPLMAGDDDSSSSNGRPTVPEPTSILASVLAAGALAGAMVYRRHRQ